MGGFSQCSLILTLYPILHAHYLALIDPIVFSQAFDLLDKKTGCSVIIEYVIITRVATGSKIFSKRRFDAKLISARVTQSR